MYGLENTSLAPVIAAGIVGLVAGSWLERWLLWRCLSNANWVYRRMRFLGDTDQVARKDAPAFAGLASSLRLNNPLLLILWLFRVYRLPLAGLLVLVIVASGVAIWLQ